MTLIVPPVITKSPLLDGLMTWLSFNETSGNLIDVHGTTNLTPTNSPVSTPGIVGTGYSFTAASSQYFSKTDPNDGSSPNEWMQFHSGAISLWFYATPTGIGTYCFAMGEASFAFFRIKILSTQISFECRSIALSESKLYNATITTNAWHHLVIQSNGTSTSLWLDGVQKTTASADTGFWFAHAFTIAPTVVAGASYPIANYWDGKLQQIAIWGGRTLSSSDIATIYNNGNGITYPGFGRPNNLGSIDVWIGCGQSQLPGRNQETVAPYTADPNDEKCYYYFHTDGPVGTRAQSNGLNHLKPTVSAVGNNGYISPMIYFGRAQVQKGKPVAVILTAVGATSLNVTWNTRSGTPTGFNDWKATTLAGLNYLIAKGFKPKIRGMIWMQGEGDCDSTAAPLYQANFTNLVADYNAYLISIGYDISSMKWVTAGPKASYDVTYAPVVRTAQQNVMTAIGGSFIDTSSYGTIDLTHYDLAGITALGNSIAALF